MNLYKIVTTQATKLTKPDLDSIISIENLNTNVLSLPVLRSLIKNEGSLMLLPGVTRQLNSNDISAIRDNGRTLIYRFDDGRYLWIIDIDHSDYIRFQRDNILDSLLN